MTEPVAHCARCARGRKLNTLGICAECWATEQTAIMQGGLLNAGRAAQQKLDRAASGATSSAIEAFDQLPYHAMRRLALRFSLGEQRHGRHNWRKGLLDKQYVIGRAGHVIRHALKLIAVMEGFIEDDGDDNAAAILWGGAFLVEAEEAMKAAGKREKEES